ncbi:hypothetical protein BAY06_07205 [Elizabethkingia anophelis]|uniref:DUF4747 family protein n=1 Tax=Elizabethkingia anophelis TaxID=1117645 RepID=UPI00099A7369|nr:DUF4747 family protein [Elizabethkingia anophelis]MCT4320905.1 DUF4747 family protein [Elizabethkingia anophelis]OPC50953.1 hypothetical protein BAY06_07205 [Elizabethkingia anophelis]HAY3534873.1 DUF4747 family protein [Elizabethkingia anophelis]HAY3546989.1 DUF4747 family protein [Elizabethkingia anophelis]HAY3591322.1 DUF4747 family protein [Elizabethkingia anophelis]
MTERKLKKKEFTEVASYIINLKIHSEETDKQKLYSSIFEQVYNLREFFVRIGNKNGLDIRKISKITFTKKELGNEFDTLEYNNYDIYIGEFVKFKIEDENDKYYNTEKKELKPGNPEAIEKPNATQIQFFFIPSIHRFFLPVHHKITPQQLKLFFEKALLEIYDNEDYFNIDISKSTEVVDKIYEFKKLKKLHLSISYTNDDLGDDAKTFMDTILKDSNITTYIGDYKAEKNDSLNMESKLIKGGIELSKENGELIAVGENDFQNRVVINTKNKFEQFPLKIKKGANPLISAIKQVLTNWRL